MINVVKLTNELIAAGIKISGCNADGVVWAEDGTTEIQKDKAIAAIIAKHDPTYVPSVSIEQRVKALEVEIERVKTSITAASK